MMDSLRESKAHLGAFGAVLAAVSSVAGNKLLDVPYLSAAGLAWIASFVILVLLTATIEYIRAPEPGPVSTVRKPRFWGDLVRRLTAPLLAGSFSGAATAALVILLIPGVARQSPPPSAIPGHAVTVTAASGDGNSKIGDNVVVTVTVSKALPARDTYWLIAQFMGGSNIVYKAQAVVPAIKGSNSFVISLLNSALGSTRTFYVLAADRQATLVLRENLNHPEPAWDGNRTTLPRTTLVSNMLVVRKQRE